MHALPTHPAPRVVFLSVSGQMGGAERLLLDLIAGLRARDPRQQLAAVVASEGPLTSELRGLGVDVHEFPIPAAVAALGDSPARARGGKIVTLTRLAMTVPAVV